MAFGTEGPLGGVEDLAVLLQRLDVRELLHGEIRVLTGSPARVAAQNQLAADARPGFIQLNDNLPLGLTSTYWVQA